MKKETYYCDRCGKELKVHINLFAAAFELCTEYELKNSGSIITTRSKSYELCKECKLEFKKFMKKEF